MALAPCLHAFAISALACFATTAANHTWNLRAAAGARRSPEWVNGVPSETKLANNCGEYGCGEKLMSTHVNALYLDLDLDQILYRSDNSGASCLTNSPTSQLFGKIAA